ncbi:MAG: PIN domain-containing protein [Acidimicrobiales bacterium]
MAVLVDTSVIIDYLRGHHGAERVLEDARSGAPLHASEMTRLEVLAGMRTNEEGATRALLSIFIWHPVDALISERAGELGRRWLPIHHSIDSADLAIAATVIVAGCELLTCNVRHFPMFKDLRKPY